MFDQYGRPLHPAYAGYGYPGYGQAPVPAPPGEPPPPGPGASAMVHQPNVHELGGKVAGQPRWYRMAYYPTAPFYSTDPEVGYQPRFYSGGILNQSANTEVLTNVQFDLPCRIIAINGAAWNTNSNADAGLNSFLFRLEAANGDKLHTGARLGGTVLGTGSQPGEIGGTGYTMDTGGVATLAITPLIANLRIDITLVCLEMRGPRNFVQAR